MAMVQMVGTFNEQQVLTPRVSGEARDQLLRLLDMLHRLEAAGINVKDSDIS